MNLNELNEKELSQLTELICNNLNFMVQSTQPNLENVINSGFSKGEDDMPSKFKERVKIGINNDGTPIYGWATGDTKEELHKSIAILLNRTDNAGSQDQLKPSPLWEECAQTWFDIFHKPRVRPKTLAKDTSVFNNHVKPAFLGKRISEIKTTDVQNYLHSKQKYSKTHLRDVMWMLRAVFSSACEDDYILKNPMDSDRIYNPSQVDKPERKALSSSEQVDIIDNLPNISSPHDRLYMAFLMFTCMRPCEILGLKWDDIDISRNTISINRDLVFAQSKTVIGDTKTPDSRREHPIDIRLRSYLIPLMNKGYIFGKNGEPISSEIVYRRMWERIKKQIDVHGMTPYIGRHTYATNMSRAGVPLKTAMAMMGHKDERMLLRTYTHSSKEDLLMASKAMSEYYNSIKSSI